MNEADWIILRLLVAGAKTPATRNPDYPKAVIYLIKKHGQKGLFKSIEQLESGRRP